MADVYGDCINETQKTFQERLLEIPAYTMTLSQLQNIYTSLKERNVVFEKTLTTGEKCVEKITNAAKPVVWAATQSALQVAKPVVGEIVDPVGKIDCAASEALAKMQEKIPLVKQTPQEMKDHAKESAMQTANYYLTKAQNSNVVQQATKHLDSMVSFSELILEMWLPSDVRSPEDIQELEIAEADEDKGVIVRAGNLKNRAVRRGKKKLMTYKTVQSTVDNVYYAQQKISSMTEKVHNGTNYVKSKYPESRSAVEGAIHKQISKVYDATMYIPNKAYQITGDWYISIQAMVYAHLKTHLVSGKQDAVTEMMPQATVGTDEVSKTITEKEIKLTGEAKENVAPSLCPPVSTRIRKFETVGNPSVGYTTSF